MAALDRLDWVENLAVDSFGSRLGLRVDDRAILSKFRAQLPPGSTGIPAGHVDFLYSICAGGPIAGSHARKLFVGYSGYTQFVRTPDEDEALDALEAQARADVAEAVSPYVFIHAGAIGWHGRGIVFPGASWSGKSQLIEALVHAGATYYSDEYAVIDAEGRLHPFARPLSLRLPTGRVRSVMPGGPGAVRNLPPLPIGAVVSTSYVAGSAWQPEAAGAAEGVMTMFANAIRARLSPGPTLATLAKAVEGATVVCAPRGEAADAAHQILSALKPGATPQPERTCA